MKKYFTDTSSNLSDAEALGLGVGLVKFSYVYKNELFKVNDNPNEKNIDETKIYSSAPNTEEYLEVFSPHIDDELVYVSCASVGSVAVDNARQANVAGLKIIDTGFWGPAVAEVLKRVINGQSYDDIKFFFVTKNPEKSTRVYTEKYCLYELRHGIFHEIALFETKFAAVAKLKTFVNTKLFFGKDLNIVNRHHYGREFVGGLFVGN